jgi:hypothetical protein
MECTIKKSAQNKGVNPYSLDKSRSARHDSLDALKLYVV